MNPELSDFGQTSAAREKKHIPVIKGIQRKKNLEVPKNQRIGGVEERSN